MISSVSCNEIYKMGKKQKSQTTKAMPVEWYAFVNIKSKFYDSIGEICKICFCQIMMIDVHTSR